MKELDEQYKKACISFLTRKLTEDEKTEHKMKKAEMIADEMLKLILEIKDMDDKTMKEIKTHMKQRENEIKARIRS